MLFSLQKIVWYLLMPPSSLIVLILSGLALRRRRHWLGSTLLSVGLVLLYCLSLEPVADLLLRPLERGANPLKNIAGRVDAVVVPGGGSVDRAWQGAPAAPNAETWTRLIAGIQLSRSLNAPLVLTGGNGEPFATTLDDADVMAAAARQLGMPQERMIIENRSRNTLENSHAVRKIVPGNRIVLATSAYYMKRARAMFEKRGFTVIPAPTFPLVQDRHLGPTSLIPSAGNLSRSSIALAEWLSLAWWRLRGEL